MPNTLCPCSPAEVTLVPLLGFNDEKIDLSPNIVVWLVTWLTETLPTVLVVSDGVAWWLIVLSAGSLVSLLVVSETNEDRPLQDGALLIVNLLYKRVLQDKCFDTMYDTKRGDEMEHIVRSLRCTEENYILLRYNQETGSQRYHLPNNCR